MLRHITTDGIYSSTSFQIVAHSDSIDSLYLPRVDYGAHPHGVISKPFAAMRFDPPISKEVPKALNEAKHKLVMYRRYFNTCTTCGRWFYVTGDRPGCDECAYRIHGVVY